MTVARRAMKRLIGEVYQRFGNASLYMGSSELISSDRLEERSTLFVWESEVFWTFCASMSSCLLNGSSSSVSVCEQERLRAPAIQYMYLQRSKCLG